MRSMSSSSSMLLMEQLALATSDCQGGHDSKLDRVTTENLIAARFVVLLISITLCEWAAYRHLLLIIIFT